MPFRVEGQDEGIDLMNLFFIDPLTPDIPAGVHQNIVHPFGGEKVHWTFSFFRLTSRRVREQLWQSLSGVPV
jgi:hypothetical protein